MRMIVFLLLFAPGLAQAQDRHKSGEVIRGDAAENGESIRGDAAGDAAPAAPARMNDTNKDESTQANRSAEKYSRKTLLYFGAKPLGFQMWGLAALSGGNIFTVRWLSEMVGQRVGQATRLKRFDFVDLPWGTRPTSKVLQMFSEFIKGAKEDKAKAEADYLERYKAYDIKASDLARIMNSAYFYETELTKARIERFAKKVCEKWVTKRVKVGKKYKSKKTCAKYGKERECVAWSNRNGKRVCKKWKIKWRYRCRLAARTDFYHLKHRFPYSSKFASVRGSSKSEAKTPRAACESSARSVAGTISVRMRRIEEFRLKAPVIDVRKKNTELGFNLGNKEGLRIDQGMYIVEYDANNRRKKIGYSRVRQVGNNEKNRKENSWAQRLTGRGSLGKQVLEDPSRGASFAFGGGSFGYLEFAGNMGYALNSAGLSETWFYFAGYGVQDSQQNQVSGGSLGIKKLWYTGRFGVGVRLGGGALMDEAQSDEALPALDAQAVIETMFGGWGALQLQGGLSPVGPGGSVGLLFHF
jgi:hypothetical protein